VPPKTYSEVVEQNRNALARARLSDPDEHFPYKHAAVTELVGQPGLPMGPGVPADAGRPGEDGADDGSRTIEDYMSQGIADASRDYVDAQAAYLEDPSDDNRAAYDAARDQLQAARLDHRANREGLVVGAAARRAG
jgi:hypothetical protein